MTKYDECPPGCIGDQEMGGCEDCDIENPDVVLSDRCPKCGSKSLIEFQCNACPEPLFCHDCDPEYECEMCGYIGHKIPDDSFERCVQCNNFKLVHESCLWCGGNQTIATLVKTLWPYHQDKRIRNRRKYYIRVAVYVLRFMFL